MEKHLHIISLDIPYPTDYGGVIDIFYKITELHRTGVRIHLHCFEYGRIQQKELEKYCFKVNYYKRRGFINSISFTTPYIVKSRNNRILTENLLKDDYPILMEGVHCTYLVQDERFKNRNLILRLHNVECVYYRNLYRSEKKWFRKMYFLFESLLLYRYEKKLAPAVTIIGVSENDVKYYKTNFSANRIFYLPVFTSFEKVNSIPGKGNYCLYHGNLSVNENEQVAIELVKKVFSVLSVPLIIAGKNPSKSLIALTEGKSNITLVPDPDNAKMQELIGNAHINILTSFISTGIKLKVLNALYNGRHCIINKTDNNDEDINRLCHKAGSTVDLIALISRLMNEEFTGSEINSRRNVLEKHYNNQMNATQLITLIW